jgi:hypothetical protein
MGDDIIAVKEDGVACREAVRKAALALGFDDCRIASVGGPAGHAALFGEWLAAGAHGTMEWMERGPERRMDPREVLPAIRTIRKHRNGNANRQCRATANRARVNSGNASFVLNHDNSSGTPRCSGSNRLLRIIPGVSDHTGSVTSINSLYTRRGCSNRTAGTPPVNPYSHA